MIARVSPAIVIGALLLVCCAGAPPPSVGDDVVDLSARAPAGRTGLLVPLRRLLPDAWTAPRVIEVRTAPPGAALELFYVRRNLQQHYAQARAPARVALPPRIEAERHDRVTVRALLDGYRIGEVELDARARHEVVTIALTPLPNRLEGFSHRSLGGRDTLRFATRRDLPLRILPDARGFRVVLADTALAPAARSALADTASALVESVEAIALGADLLVTVALSERARADGVEPRARRWRDPARDLHGFAIDLAPRDGDDARAARLRDALARVPARDVGGCALVWERTLRGELGSPALARALAPGGGEDAFLLAAMGRLGALSDGGIVRTDDARAFRADVPIERIAAASLASQVVGFLALLRGAVAGLEPADHRDDALRGLIAPQLELAQWRSRRDRADDAERRCAELARRATRIE